MLFLRGLVLVGIALFFPTTNAQTCGTVWIVNGWFHPACPVGLWFRHSPHNCCQCPRGQFQDTKTVGNFHNQRSCKSCPSGRFQDSFESIDCRACSAGKFSGTGAVGCTNCAVGRFQNSMGQSGCRNCPAGFHAGSTGSSGCARCSAGRFASARSSSCNACPTGQFSGDGSSTCTTCPTGQFAESTGNPSCSGCEAGRFQNSRGQSSCTQCPAGRFQGSRGQTSCSLAPQGRYAGAGATSSTPCPAGKYSAGTGAQDSNCDGNCNPGRFCSGTGNTSPDGTVCPAGRYGRAGESSSQCTAACDAGFYCPAGTGEDDQKRCGAVDKYCPSGSKSPSSVSSGHYSTPEDAPTNRRTGQSICPQGHFCVGGERKQCPAGRFSSVEGQTSSSCEGVCLDGYLCEAGSVSNRDEVCSNEDPKYFCVKGKREICPDGRFTTPEDPDTSTRTGCEKCPGPEFSCINGIKSKKTAWKDDFCKGSSQATLFIDEIADPPGSAVNLNARVFLEVRTSWDSLSYSIKSVKQNGRDRDGVSCDEDMTSWPFAMNQVPTDDEFQGIEQRKGDLQIAAGETIRFATCDKFDVEIEATVTEPDSTQLTSTCSISVVVQHKNSPPEKLPEFGSIDDKMKLSTLSDKAHGEPVGDPLAEAFTDPDNDELSFTLVDESGNPLQGSSLPFSLGVCTGQISVSNAAVLSTMPGEVVNLWVEVSDNFPGDPKTLMQEVEISVLQPNRPPEVNENPPRLFVVEKSEPGTKVVTVDHKEGDDVKPLSHSSFVTDPDGDDIDVSFRACQTETYCKAFTIDSENFLVVEDNDYLDHDRSFALPRFVRVLFSDGVNEPVEGFIPLTVQELRKAPVITTKVFDMDETATGVVGMVDASDEHGDTFLFEVLSITNNRGEKDESRIHLEEQSGELSVNPGEVFQSIKCEPGCIDCTFHDTKITIVVTATIQNRNDDLSGPTTSEPTSIEISILTVNEPPVFLGISSDITMLELQSGTIEDLSKFFCDREGDRMFYDILSPTGSDPFGNYFAVGGTSGKLEVRGGFQLNYEDEQTHDITVRVEDNGSPSKSNEQVFTVWVVDVPEPPVLETTLIQVDELTTASDGVQGHLSASDPDILSGSGKPYASEPSQFKFVSTSHTDQIAISEQGSVSIAPGYTPDFETLFPNYVLEVEVIVVDFVNNVNATSSFSLEIIDIDEPPFFDPPQQEFTLPHFSVEGADIGILQADDPDFDEVLTFSFHSGVSFVSITSTGLMFLNKDANLTTGEVYKFKATVTDRTNLSDTQEHTITITNPPEPPVWGDGSPEFQNHVPKVMSIDEHHEGVFKSFSPHCVDPNEIGIHFQILQVSPIVYDDIFRMNRDTGMLEVLSPDKLDFETIENVNATFTVVCVDSNGLRVNGTLILQVQDIDEPPILGDIASDPIVRSREDVSIGTILTQVDAWDPDASSAFELKFRIFKDGPNSSPLETGTVRFEDDGHTAVSDIKTTMEFDYFEQNEFQVFLEVEDEANLKDSVSLTYQLEHVNQAPVFDDSSFYHEVYENITSDTAIVTDFPFSDRDIGDTHTFEVTWSNTPGVFEFRGTELRLRSGMRVDYETLPEHRIMITVTDQDGLSDRANVTLTILNVNDLDISMVLWESHDTVGGSIVTFRGENFGPVWSSATIEANLRSSDGQVFLESLCKRESMEGTWINTEMNCTVPTGVGKDLIWRITIDNDRFLGDNPITSYENPLITEITQWPSPASTVGGEKFVLKGRYFGPTELQDEGGRTFRTPVSVEYKSGTEEFQVDFEGRSCEVVDDEHIQCETSPGFGKDFEFVVIIGDPEASWNQDSHIFVPSKSIGFDPPYITSVHLLTATLPSTGVERGIGLSGSNFGSSLEQIHATITNGDFTFASQCKERLNHTFVICDWPSGVGVGYTWTITVADQTSPASADAVSFDPPLLESVLDMAGRVPTDMDTNGNEVVQIRGNNFGDESLQHVISVTYGANDELVARDCEVVSAHTLIRCITSEGVGKDHSWRISVASQTSNQLVEITNYHPPVVATYRRPGKAGIGITDLRTPGFDIVVLGGNHFGPEGTHVQDAVYGSGNESFVATSCNVTSTREMRCFTSPGAGASHFWTVTIGGQVSTISTTSYKRPNILSFEGVDGSDPDDLYTEGGQSIDLVGENFGPKFEDGTSFLDTVTFGPLGTEVTLSDCYVKSHARIRCIVPQGFGQKHQWMVVVAGQSSTLSRETTSYAVPRITHMNPTRGPTGPEPTTVTFKGTDLGGTLFETTDITVLVDNEGHLQRMVEADSITNPLNTVHRFLQIQQQDPSTANKRLDEDGLPVSTLWDWVDGLTKIAIQPDDAQVGSSDRLQTLTFKMPSGFGISRVVFLKVGNTFSSLRLFDYDGPVIENIAPSLPLPGRQLVRVTIDGRNFCGGSSCASTACCGKVFVAGELLEVESDQYRHNQIVAFVPANLPTRILYVEVLDHPNVTEAVEFEQVAPSISGQKSADERPALSTQGGDILRFFNATGVASGTGEALDIVVEINKRQCTNVEVTATRQEGSITFADFHCTTPSNVGHGLEVLLTVDGTTGARNEMEVNYDGPTICYVTTAERSILLYRSPSLPPKCREDQFSDLVELSVSTEVGIPTTGANVSVHGFNLGAANVPGVDGSLSIQRTAQASIPAFRHRHDIATYFIPEGSGGILNVHDTSSRQLGDANPVETEFSQSMSRFTGSTATFTFSYNSPKISGLVPDELPTLPDTDMLLYIHGHDFGPAPTVDFSPDIQVMIGDKPCAIVSSNHTLITCNPPPSQGKNVPLVLTIDGQVDSTTIDYRKANLFSVSPLECPTSGYNQNGARVNVTIVGSDVGVEGTVKISDTSGTNIIEVIDATFSHDQVIFACPEGHGEDLKLSVVVFGWQLTSEGALTSDNSLDFNYERPVVTEVKRVRKTDAGFNEFEDNECAPFERCTSNDDEEFCMLEYPTCFPTVGDVPVKIIGRNFGRYLGSSANVIAEAFIGGQICTITSTLREHHTHEGIICILQEGVGVKLSVQVGLNQRLSAPAEAIFSYDPPRINNVIPNTPDAEGDDITFRGDNFGPQGGPVSVLIGGLPCADSEVLGHDRIECTIPRDVVGAKSIDLTVAGRDNVSFPFWMELVVSRCVADWYGLEGEECLYCPTDARGAVCPGGERFEDRIYADEGWWRIDETEPYERCHEKREHREKCPTFLPCEPKWACIGNNECLEGYTGQRCDSCIEGSYFRINGECQKCPDNAWLLGVGLAVAAVAGAVGGYIINTKNIQLAAFTIGIDYFQVLAMFGRTRVQWPSVMEETLTILSFFNFNLELAAPECYLSPAPPFEYKWLATMALPLACLVLLGFVYFLHYLYKLLVLKRPAKERHTHLNALVASFLIVFYILYLFLTRMTLDVFNCAPTDPPDGNLYMSGRTEIICGESSVHVNLLLPLAAVTTVIYVAAFPVGSYLFLKKNKERVKYDQILRAHHAGWSKLSNPNYDFRKRFQRLYYLFKPGKWYWILLILLRKFLIALTSLMFRATPSYQLAMSLLVIFAAYALQVKHEPYLSPKDYQLVVDDHILKANAGDKLHCRIQALMEEIKSKNTKATKKRNGWNDIEFTQPQIRKQPPTGFIANFLMNYNTVEVILLGSAILVNLAGIMFLSGRFQGDQRERHESEFELLGILTMIVVVISCVYFVFVFGFELLNTFAPKKAERVIDAFKSKNVATAQRSFTMATLNDDATGIFTKVNPLVPPLNSEQAEDIANKDAEIERLRKDLHQSQDELRSVKKGKRKGSLLVGDYTPKWVNKKHIFEQQKDGELTRMLRSEKHS